MGRKIFYVIDYYDGPTGGTERQLYYLIEGMVQRGHDVTLFVLQHTEFTRNEAFVCPIECLQVNSITAPATVPRMLAFRKRVRQQNPSVVHAYFNDSAILVPLACAGLPVTVVTSRRDMGYWYTPKYIAALRATNPIVDLVICNSEIVAAHTRNREHLNAWKTRVIYNAIPSVDAAAIVPAVKDLPVQAGTEFKVCLVANRRPIKKVEDLIHAAELVGRTCPEAVFWLIGEDSNQDYCSRLRSLVTQLGVGNRVVFFPETKRPMDFILQCDVGVLTSESEGLSNSILEYMAHGLAIVCSDVGGNAELVGHGDNGFLYPFSDVKMLAHYLEVMCKNRALTVEMGSRGRTRSARFSSGSMIARHLEAYRIAD